MKYLGYISKTVGLKGDVEIKDYPLYIDDLLNKKINLYLGEIKIKRAYEVVDLRKKVLHFLDFNTIEEASILKGLNIYIDDDALKDIDPFLNPIGKEICIKGLSKGKVINLFKNGPSNYLIETDTGKMYPYHKDLIISIDSDKINYKEYFDDY